MDSYASLTNSNTGLDSSLSPEYFTSELEDYSSPKVLDSDPWSVFAIELKYIVLVVTIVEPHKDLQEYYQAPCTGTLIRYNLVFTTASCLIRESHFIPDPSSTTVFDRSGNLINVLKIYIHPKYIYSSSYNFAVILVENSTQTVFPKLPENLTDFKQIMNKCLLAGYGNQVRPTLTRFQIVRLNETSVDIIKCRQTSKTLRSMCLYFKNLCSCSGDVGSPILCEDELYAVFTPRGYVEVRDTSCLDLFAATFTPVFQVRGWVERISSSAADNLEWMNNPLYIMLLCGSALCVIGGIYYCLVEVLVKRLTPVPDESEDVSRISSHYSLSLEEPVEVEGMRKWSILDNFK